MEYQSVVSPFIVEMPLDKNRITYVPEAGSNQDTACISEV